MNNLDAKAIKRIIIADLKSDEVYRLLPASMKKDKRDKITEVVKSSSDRLIAAYQEGVKFRTNNPDAGFAEVQAKRLKLGSASVKSNNGPLLCALLCCFDSGWNQPVD